MLALVEAWILLSFTDQALVVRGSPIEARLSFICLTIIQVFIRNVTD